MAKFGNRLFLLAAKVYSANYDRPPTKKTSSENSLTQTNKYSNLYYNMRAHKHEQYLILLYPYI